MKSARWNGSKCVGHRWHGSWRCYGKAVLGCFRLVDWEEMVRLVDLRDITKTRNLAGRDIL